MRFLCLGPSLYIGRVSYPSRRQGSILLMTLSEQISLLVGGYSTDLLHDCIFMRFKKQTFFVTFFKREVCELNIEVYLTSYIFC